MNIKSNDWVFVTGQADSGKTYWMKAHIKKFPVGECYIYDFNSNDYQEFNKQWVWSVQQASQEEFEEYLKIVYSKGNCFCIMDESDNYLEFPSQFIRQFVNTARNRGIGAIVNAKRAMAVKPVFRNRFTHLVLFRCIIPEDIDYLEKWAGTGRGSLQHLKTLGQGYHVIIDLQKQEISEVQRL